MTDLNELDKIKYQVFYEKKQKELYMSIYPSCVQQCEQRHSNSDEKLVFTEGALLCAQNCLQKHKSSMNLAL